MKQFVTPIGPFLRGEDVMRMFIPVLFVVSALAPASAQQPPPPNDAGLLLMFFHFHDGVSAELSREKAIDPAAGAKSEKLVARLLKIQPAEVSKVGSVARGLVVDIAKWQNEVKVYAEQARGNKKEPDAAALMQFEQRKQQLIDVAMQQLRAGLSAQSWAGLSSYINDEYRLRLKSVSFRPTPKP